MTRDDPEDRPNPAPEDGERGRRSRRRRPSRRRGADPLGPIKQRWALLIGVNQYIDPTIRNLNYAVNDVQEMAALLQDLGYETVVVHDEVEEPFRTPTRDNIEAELKTLCQAAQREDLLLVYFAGHGVRIGEKAFLLTREIRRATLSEKALTVQQIEMRVRRSAARRKVVLLDACHAGSDVGNRDLDTDFTLHAHELAEGYALIAASTAGQAAQEVAGLRSGVFTEHVLEALRGKADREDKGYVTVDDVKTYALTALRRWHVRSGRAPQEPTSRLDGMGDMILADLRDGRTLRGPDETRHETEAETKDEADDGGRGARHDEPGTTKKPLSVKALLGWGVTIAAIISLALLLPKLLGQQDGGTQTVPVGEVTPAPVEVRHVRFDRKLAVGETVDLTCETPGHEECAVTAFIERGEEPPLQRDLVPSGASHSVSIDLTDDLAPLLRYWFEISVCGAVRSPQRDSYVADVLPRVTISHSAPAARCSGESVTFSAEVADRDDCDVTAEIIRSGESVATIPLAGTGASYSGSYSIPAGTPPGSLRYRLHVDTCGVGEWPGGDGSQTVPIRSRSPRPHTFPGASLFTGGDLAWKVELPCQSGCVVKAHWWRGEGARRSVTLGGSGTIYEGSLRIDSSGPDVDYFIEAEPPCSGRWPATGHKTVNIL